MLVIYLIGYVKTLICNSINAWQNKLFQKIAKDKTHTIIVCAKNYKNKQLLKFSSHHNSVKCGDYFSHCWSIVWVTTSAVLNERNKWWP